MSLLPISDKFKSMWKDANPEEERPATLLYLVFLGFLVGFFSGVIIAIFRITTNKAYSFILHWTASNDTFLPMLVLWIGGAVAAALFVGWLIRNQAIRFGGAGWVLDALADGQNRPWLKILLPKFVGSWLVMAFGISVGREGPCIQMGAATALGIKNLDAKNAYERRYFILGGCAAGLAAAFSAPFAGICYVFEIMKENITRTLFVFLFAGSFGVYVSATKIFGLDVMLPFGPAPIPGFWQLWILVPLGIFAAAVGIAYNYLLRISKYAYGNQKKIPVYFEPLFAFVGAAIMVIAYPSITGEGLTIFASIQNGSVLVGTLFIFLAAKLVFTAFCYGSAIPAGLMVPVLCLGGVAGGIYADLLANWGILNPQFSPCCIVIGMSGAFAAAERAPVTGMMLVAEMTGAYAAVPGMLLVTALATFLARLAKVRAV